MATVKVLVDAVGAYNAGDIVPDAPEGLIDIARRGVVNAATGQRLAEIVEEQAGNDEWLSEREILLAQLDDANRRIAELEEEVSSYQSAELKELRQTAKELKIAGYTKMDAEQLKEAISTSGGEGAGEPNTEN